MSGRSQFSLSRTFLRSSSFSASPQITHQPLQCHFTQCTALQCVDYCSFDVSEQSQRHISFIEPAASWRPFHVGSLDLPISQAPDSQLSSHSSVRFPVKYLSPRSSKITSQACGDGKGLPTRCCRVKPMCAERRPPREKKADRKMDCLVTPSHPHHFALSFQQLQPKQHSQPCLHRRLHSLPTKSPTAKTLNSWTQVCCCVTCTRSPTH